MHQFSSVKSTLHKGHFWKSMYMSKIEFALKVLQIVKICLLKYAYTQQGMFIVMNKYYLRNINRLFIQNLAFNNVLKMIFVITAHAKMSNIFNSTVKIWRYLLTKYSKVKSVQYILWMRCISNACCAKVMVFRLAEFAAIHL